MSKARILRGLVLLASLALALMVSAPRLSPVAQAPLPGDSGQFAIDSNRDGNEEIYVTNADGSGKTTWGSRVHTHTAVFFYSVAVGPRGGAGLYVVHRAKPCANVAGGVSLLLVLERAT